jgi:hypothetical protein
MPANLAGTDSGEFRRRLGFPVALSSSFCAQGHRRQGDPRMVFSEAAIGPVSVLPAYDPLLCRFRNILMRCAFCGCAFINLVAVMCRPSRVFRYINGCRAHGACRSSRRRPHRCLGRRRTDCNLRDVSQVPATRHCTSRPDLTGQTPMSGQRVILGTTAGTLLQRFGVISTSRQVGFLELAGGCAGDQTRPWSIGHSGPRRGAIRQ